MFGGLYSNTTGHEIAPLFDNWGLGPSDPLQSKAEALVAFCYPDPSLLAPGSQEARNYESLKGILTAENIKHFLEEYKNFHSHWPMIHMPTFNPINANDGLVLAMVCLGAVYSSRLGMKGVRWLMEHARASIHRSSSLYKLVSQNTQAPTDTSVWLSADIEEVQSLVLLHSLFVWNGSQKQRQQGRAEYWVLAEVTRRANLMNPVADGHPSFSALHQPGPLTGNEVNTWTWTAWVEQEKRARTMYLVFLIDAALTIFFNAQPRFDPYEINLPLPADDAAWEAKTDEACASALGLRGESAQARNTTGSKRPKQIGMPEALQLLHRSGDFPQRATNVYSKFILIHAIHVQIYNIQRQMLGLHSLPGYNGFSSGTSTPQSQNEWAPNDGTISGGNSGSATPIEGINSQYAQAHQKLRLTMGAVELWKKIWDADMHIQYASNQRRDGFCRDGIHFYFLARVFAHSSRREEWAASPDIRFHQVFNLLKQIRAHVATDSAQKGLNIGSVTTVADDYGVADLTLDMKLLFTPIDHSNH